MVHWTVQFTCCHQKDLLILTDQIMFASWKRAQMMDLKNSQLIVGTPLWMRFCKSNTDGRMYVKSVKEANCRISSVILGVYVEDIIPVSNDSAMLKAEKAALNVCERFEMIDLEDNYTLSSWYINQARQRAKNIDNMSAQLHRERAEKVWNGQTANLSPLYLSLVESFSSYLQGMSPLMFRPTNRQVDVWPTCTVYMSTATRPDTAAAVGVIYHITNIPSLQMLRVCSCCKQSVQLFSVPSQFYFGSLGWKDPI